MLKKTSKIFLAILFISCFNNVQSQEKKKTVMLDVGHTPENSGAVSAFGKSEYSYNQILVNTIQNTLKQHGFNVLLTNAYAQEISLDERVNLATTYQPAVLISIHHDAVQSHYLNNWIVDGKQQKMSRYAHGFSLFVSKENIFYQKSLYCASAIGAELTNQGLKPSPHHAVNEPGEHRAWADKKHGVYFFDRLKLLRKSSVPALLIEAGVITHPVEAKTLESSEYQQLQADAIVRGLTKCL